jgi:hypothetical protein
MNRRSFLDLVGKLVSVGAAMGVAPALLEPIRIRIQVKTQWVVVPMEVRSILIECWGSAGGDSADSCRGRGGGGSSYSRMDTTINVKVN